MKEEKNIEETETVELSKYIVCGSEQRVAVEELINKWADTHYLKFFQTDSQYGHVAVLSRRTPDKYEGVTNMTEVKTMKDANELLENGWYVLQAWKDKIRLGIRE